MAGDTQSIARTSVMNDTHRGEELPTIIEESLSQIKRESIMPWKRDKTFKVRIHDKTKGQRKSKLREEDLTDEM